MKRKEDLIYDRTHQLSFLHQNKSDPDPMTYFGRCQTVTPAIYLLYTCLHWLNRVHITRAVYLLDYFSAGNMATCQSNLSRGGK